ncbi:hypothetical protein Tco_0566305 [Tanacetum coccineum]
MIEQQVMSLVGEAQLVVVVELEGYDMHFEEIMQPMQEDPDIFHAAFVLHLHVPLVDSDMHTTYQSFSTWMTFGGNTRDLGSFGEETDEITDLRQIHKEILFSERGDGVAGIKRRRRDPSGDGVRDLVTASRRGRLNKDLESST